MDRKEFLYQIGLGAAGLVIFSCLGGCEKKVPSAATNVNMTLDLSKPANAALDTKGGCLVTSNGIIVAQTLTGTFIAVSVYCTHQGVNVQYQSASNQFSCPAHGSVFSSSGAVVNGPAGSPLKQYTVVPSTTGSVTTLTITG